MLDTKQEGSWQNLRWRLDNGMCRSTKIRENSDSPQKSRYEVRENFLQGKIENWKLCNAFCQLDGLAVN